MQEICGVAKPQIQQDIPFTHQYLLNDLSFDTTVCLIFPS